MNNARLLGLLVVVFPYLQSAAAELPDAPSLAPGKAPGITRTIDASRTGDRESHL